MKIFILIALATLLLSPIPAHAQQPPDYQATVDTAQWYEAQARRAQATATAQTAQTATAESLQATAQAQAVEQRATATAQSQHSTAEGLHQIATGDALATTGAREAAEWERGNIATAGALRARVTAEHRDRLRNDEIIERDKTLENLLLFVALGVIMVGGMGAMLAAGLLVRQWRWNRSVIDGEYE